MGAVCERHAGRGYRKTISVKWIEAEEFCDLEKHTVLVKLVEDAAWQSIAMIEPRRVHVERSWFTLGCTSGGVYGATRMQDTGTCSSCHSSHFGLSVPSVWKTVSTKNYFVSNIISWILNDSLLLLTNRYRNAKTVYKQFLEIPKNNSEHVILLRINFYFVYTLLFRT